MTDSAGSGVQERDNRTIIGFLSIGLFAVIAFNVWLLWYFLVGMPSGCAARAAATAGRETCGWGPAVPVLLVLGAALIVTSLFLLYRWHVQKKGM